MVTQMTVWPIHRIKLRYCGQQVLGVGSMENVVGAKRSVGSSKTLPNVL